MVVLVTAKDSQLGRCIYDLVYMYPDFEFIFKSSSELNLTNKNQTQKIFNSLKPDYCINCAAYTKVDDAESNYNEALSVNAEGVKNLAQVCRENQTTIIHVSTDFVFNGSSRAPYLETDETNPLNNYGKTKLEGELALQRIIHNYFIIRTSWLYSEYGNNFMKTMLKLATVNEEIGVVEDQIGCPTYAQDLALTILQIISNKSTDFGIYHYCNSGKISWYDFANEIYKQSGVNIKLNRIKSKDFKRPAQRPSFSVLNTNKIKKSFKLQIANWKESLSKALINYNMQKQLETAISAALEAGEAIMKVYESEIAVEYKGDKSPLTEADKRANDIINKYLKQTEYPIISEENKQTDYKIRKEWDICWIVDPVDGTKEFIKRNGEFTVNIALVKSGKPVLGVVYVPATKILYFANVIKNQAFKAVLNSHSTSVNAVFKTATHLSKPSTTNEIIRVVGSRSHMNIETTDFIESLKNEGKNVEIVSKGSSLKFCIIAEGGADVYPRFAPTMEWDTAAGQAVCNSLGIEVISQESNAPLSYNKKNLLNPWFIVS
jgi:3'(2'), 5'-bisphosphate nucleotidase